MFQLNSGNVTRHKALIERSCRERLHGRKGAVIWFTGLSVSGKSTLSHLVEKELYDMGCSTYVFDGVNVRHGLCGDLGFSEKDREGNIRRIGGMVKLFVDALIIDLTAFISPFRKVRERVRSMVGDDHFIEVFVDCPLRYVSRMIPKGFIKRH